MHYPDDVYDALMQVEAQALDWALPATAASSGSFKPPEPGSMANPFLGLFMVIATAVGIFFMDAYLGFSFLPSLFLKDAPDPRSLWDEAFAELHKKIGVESEECTKGGGGRVRGKYEAEEEEEREGLLEIEMVPTETETDSLADTLSKI